MNYTQKRLIFPMNKCVKPSVIAIVRFSGGFTIGPRMQISRPSWTRSPSTRIWMPRRIRRARGTRRTRRSQSPTTRSWSRCSPGPSAAPPSRARACRSTTPSSASKPPCRTRSAASTPTSTRPPRTDSVSFDTQAAYYRRALELAYCQATVRGPVRLPHLRRAEPRRLAVWPLLRRPHAEAEPLPAFKRTVADLRSGLVRCR